MSKATLLFLIITCATAQQTSGLLHFDWDKLAAKAVEKTNVNLDGSMLEMASRFLSGAKGDADMEKIKSVVQGLKGIYVKSFTFDKEGEYSQADVSALRSQISGPGWSNIVDVQEKHESSAIYMKTDGKQAQGMVIISAEPKELTVVQILGAIDPAALSDLSGKMGIPHMRMGPKSKKDD